MKRIAESRSGATGIPVSSGGVRGVALFGGGTGGHLYPGLALCEHLREHVPECHVTVFRSGRVVESHVFEGANVNNVVLEIEPPGTGPSGPFRFLRQVRRGVREVRDYMRCHPVDVAIGLGGYASVPGLVAARSMKIPVVLLEQNARPGKVNRLFGPFSSCVACASPESVAGFGALRRLARIEDTGNPLRRQVIEARHWRQARTPVERRRDLGFVDRRVVVVFGGSQGSRAVNRAVTEAVPGARAFSEKISFIHMTGTTDKDSVEAAYRRAGWDARVAAFDPELPSLLAGADLVVARAGGTTLAELAAIGVPSVLVPFPGHRDQHQRINARALEARGAAIVLDEEEFVRRGMDVVFDRLFDDTALRSMERAASRAARVDGVDRVAELIGELAGARRGTDGREVP